MLQTARLPKLRTDIAVHAQQTASGTIYGVKDPDSGQFYKLGEAAEFIARQFDGETSPDAFAQRWSSVSAQRSAPKR